MLLWTVELKSQNTLLYLISLTNRVTIIDTFHFISNNSLRKVFQRQNLWKRNITSLKFLWNSCPIVKIIALIYEILTSTFSHSHFPIFFRNFLTEHLPFLMISVTANERITRNENLQSRITKKTHFWNNLREFHNRNFEQRQGRLQIKSLPIYTSTAHIVSHF